MINSDSLIWHWKELEVAWKSSGNEIKSQTSILLIHGFGACKEHWRHNQEILGKIATCYSIDLIGFGQSSQPYSTIEKDKDSRESFIYNFDNWAEQISNFCNSIIQNEVILIGNSIGGIIALKAAKLLNKKCKGVILINCALRTMDDKRLKEQSMIMQYLRPALKLAAKQRWISKNLFRIAANRSFINNILKKAYPSGENLNAELIDILYKPTVRFNASEAFHGFINIFDDYLAPQLMKNLEIPVDLIWGEKDPWEPLKEAKEWIKTIKCVQSLAIIEGKGHCPHDESPEKVNPILIKLIQHAI